MAVQLVGRLEGHHPSTRAGEGEQQRLQHLVRSVGGEDLLGRHAVQCADRLAEVGRGAVGVAVPVQAGELGRERISPGRRGRLGRQQYRKLNQEHVQKDPARYPRGRGHRPGGGQGVATAAGRTAAGHDDVREEPPRRRDSCARVCRSAEARRRPLDLQLRGALPAARRRAPLVREALRPLGRRRARRPRFSPLDTAEQDERSNKKKPPPTACAYFPEAQQVTLAEAMVLASWSSSRTRTRPTRGAAGATTGPRWHGGGQLQVALGVRPRGPGGPGRSDPGRGRLAAVYPTPYVPSTASARPEWIAPTGLVVNHALSELRQNDQFRDKPTDYIQNGGFRIVTTVDKRAQDAAEAAADIRRDTTPAPLRGSPPTGRPPWSRSSRAPAGCWPTTAATTAPAPTTPAGTRRGRAPRSGSANIRRARRSRCTTWPRRCARTCRCTRIWDSPATKEFPNSGRSRHPAGPVRNASTAACQPGCTLLDATVASLNVPFFDLTEKLGAATCIEMAAKAGIDSMWADVDGPAHAGADRPARQARQGARRPTVLHRGGHRPVRRHRAGPRQRHGHLRRRRQAGPGPLRPGGAPSTATGCTPSTSTRPTSGSPATSSTS